MMWALEGMVRDLFRGCTTRSELAQALTVALADKGNTAEDVNRIYHEVLDEKGWR
jgi:hypothetical protein